MAVACPSAHEVRGDVGREPFPGKPQQSNDRPHSVWLTLPPSWASYKQ